MGKQPTKQPAKQLAKQPKEPKEQQQQQQQHKQSKQQQAPPQRQQAKQLKQPKQPKQPRQQPKPLVRRKGSSPKSVSCADIDLTTTKLQSCKLRVSVTMVGSGSGRRSVSVA